MKSVTTVELFCGIGGFRVASDSLGYKTLWANDIKDLACSVYRDNFGENELNKGNIQELKESVPDHDILTAGFPCQPFSSAGKKEGTRDPRGTLFQSVVDIVSHRRPKYFVLENVKRLISMESGVHFATILDSLASQNYLIEWRVLNAMDFGLAQNRQRVFIVGTRSDVLNVDSTVFKLGSESDFGLTQIEHEKLLSPPGWGLINQHGAKFSEWGLAQNGRFFASTPTKFTNAMKSQKLLDVLEAATPEEFDFTDSTIDRIGRSEAVDRFVQGVQIISNQAGGARMGYTVFGVDGVAPTLTASTSRHYERYKVGDRYRRLTNIEYARLQGFSDKHATFASKYDQYQLYGNAVPPPMAAWVLAQIVSAGIDIRSVAPLVQNKKSDRRQLVHNQMGLFSNAD